MNVPGLWVILLLVLVASVHGTTLSRDVVTYLNVFRHLHAAGPLLVNDNIQKAAQHAAKKFAVTQNKNSATTSKYSANFCIFAGVQSHLPQTCVVSWYSTIGNHQWCNPQTKGPALPFVNMIWKSSAQVGVGIAKGTGAKYFVVVYFMLQNTKIEGSVPPVKLVMEASPKAKCPTGYSRCDTSCFKYHTERMTWDEAVIQCAKENATLASIRNGKEETFVRGLEKAVSGDETWIGLHDRFQEGQFNWLDGLKFQPGVCVPVRATGNNNENCVAWSIKRPPGCWSDRPCAQKLPFACRVPVEGTSTYRTEVLFKKFRWNPKFRDPKSKAYRDLIRGIKVTFNEVFTRLSGKKKAGFKKVKIKGLRPVTFPGRPVRGLAITLSVQFRSLTPDPTLRFTSFLRSSEKVLNVAIDKPDKVPGKLVGAGNYCSSPCAAQLQGTCGATTTWYPQMVTCPQTCSQTTVQSCPAFCPASCCNAVYQPSSPYAYYPYATGYHPPAFQHVVPPPAPPVSTGPSTYSLQPTKAVSSTYAPQYSPSCPSYCGQYSTLDCYMHCNDECCKGGGSKDDKVQSTASLISKMKDNVRHLKRIIKVAEKKVTAPAASGLQNSSAGYTANSSTSKLVKTLKANLRALGKKLQNAEENYIENFENDESSLEAVPENEDNSNKTGLTQAENSKTEADNSISAASNNSHPSSAEAEPEVSVVKKVEKHIDNNAFGVENALPKPDIEENDVEPLPSTFTKHNDQNLHASVGNDSYEGYPQNNSLGVETKSSESFERYANRSTPEQGKLGVETNSSESFERFANRNTPEQGKLGVETNSSESFERFANRSTPEQGKLGVETNSSQSFERFANRSTPEEGKPGAEANSSESFERFANRSIPEQGKLGVETNSSQSFERFANRSTPEEGKPGAEANSSESFERFANRSTPEQGNKSPLLEPASEAAPSRRPVGLNRDRTKSTSPESKTAQLGHRNVSVKNENFSGLNFSEAKLGLNRDQESPIVGSHYNSTADTLELRENSSQPEHETRLNLKEPDVELRNDTDTDFDEAFKSKNSSLQSSNSLAELNSGTRLNSANGATHFRETPSDEFSTKDDLYSLREDINSDSRLLNGTRGQSLSDSDLYSPEDNRIPTKYHSNSDLDFVGRESQTHDSDTEKEDDVYAENLNSALADEEKSEYAEGLRENSVHSNAPDLENSADLESLRSDEENNAYVGRLRETSTRLNASETLGNKTQFESLNSTLANEENNAYVGRLRENSTRLNASETSGNKTQFETLNSTLANEENRTYFWGLKETTAHLNPSDSKNSTVSNKLNSTIVNEKKTTYTGHLKENSAYLNPSDSNSKHTENLKNYSAYLNPSDSNSKHTENLKENNAYLNPSDSNSKHTENLKENSAYLNPSDSNSKHTENLKENSAYLNPSDSNSKHTENLKENRVHSNNAHPVESTSIEKPKRINAHSNSTLVDSKLKKSNNSVTGYYYGGMTTIDDGLSNSSSSKQEYMTAGRVWRERLIKNTHQSNRTNQTSPAQNIMSSDANENQVIDNQFHSIDNDRKSDEDDEQLNVDMHDPDSESEIDGNDTFKDKSMEDPPQNGNADIDDGVIDDSPNLQRDD